MELTITKEKVIEAASKCSQAKEILKTLFPEVFEEDKYFDLRTGTEEGERVYVKDGLRIDVCNLASDEYKNKAFLLRGAARWELVPTGIVHNSYLLIPTRKP